MSSISILGDTSGSVLLQAPAVAGSTVVNIGATTGTIQAGAPAFSAFPSSNQTISFNTQTKVLLQTEEFDTNNNFASSTFTPTVAGYYNVSGQVRIDFTAGRQVSTTISIFKNGSVYLAAENSQVAGTGGSITPTINAIVPMNGSSDTLELYIYQYDYTANAAYSTVSVQVRFQGFWARSL